MQAVQQYMQSSSSLALAWQQLFKLAVAFMQLTATVSTVMSSRTRLSASQQQLV
jgi:hypothetical protein